MPENFLHAQETPRENNHWNDSFKKKIWNNIGVDTIESVSDRVNGLYQWTSKEEIKPWMNEWTIMCEWKPYTVVYPSGISHWFESTNTKITYLLPEVKIERRMNPELLVSVWTQITPQLKWLFSWVSWSSELANEENWHKVDGRKLFTIADNLRKDLNLPYIGGQSSDGEFVWRTSEYGGKSVSIYLPICVGMGNDMKFVQILIDEDSKSAKFLLYDAIPKAYPLASFSRK